MLTPAEIVWEKQASNFIDSMVERDVAYLEYQQALERLIHAGLHDEITQTFDLDGHVVQIPPDLVPTSKQTRDLPAWLPRAGTEPAIVRSQIDRLAPRSPRVVCIEDHVRCC